MKFFSFNEISLIGRIGSIEERVTSKGTPIVKFSLATDDGYKNKDTGDYVKNTIWHKCIVIGDKASQLVNHIDKGDLIHVVGKLKYNDWEDKNGVKHHSPEIYVGNTTILTNNKKSDEKLEDSSNGVSYSDYDPYSDPY